MRLFGRKDSPDTAPPIESEEADGLHEGPDPALQNLPEDRWGQQLHELAHRVDSLEGQLAALESKLQELGEDTEDRIRRLTAAIAEGIEHVDRSERRVRAVVQRAQQRVRDAGYEDAGLEAEAAELRRIDGEGSGPEGMQTMHEDVGHGQQLPFDWTGVPGEVSASNLRELGLA